MVEIRLTGTDTATGLERPIQAGDTIENFASMASAMSFKGAIDGAGYPFPALANRYNGDVYTIISGAPIVDPEAPGQTVQPGDEIVWDGTALWWVVIANADAGNISAGLLTILTVDEDLLVRKAAAITRLGIGAAGTVLQASGGVVAYGDVDGPLLNVLTVDEDLLLRTGGAAQRLPVGAPGEVLTVNAGPTVAWAAGGGGIPKTAQEWYIDPANGVDTQSGAREAPVRTTQKALELAHAVDVAAVGNSFHVFYLRPGDYSAETEVYIGSDLPLATGSWLSDTPDHINCVFVGENGGIEVDLLPTTPTGPPNPTLYGVSLRSFVVNNPDGFVFFKNIELEEGSTFPLQLIRGTAGFTDCNVSATTIGAAKAGFGWAGADPWPVLATTASYSRLFARNTPFQTGAISPAVDVDIPTRLIGPLGECQMLDDNDWSLGFDGCKFVNAPTPGVPAFRGLGGPNVGGVGGDPSGYTNTSAWFYNCKFQSSNPSMPSSALSLEFFKAIELRNNLFAGNLLDETVLTDNVVWLVPQTWCKVHENHFINAAQYTGAYPGHPNYGGNIVTIANRAYIDAALPPPGFGEWGEGATVYWGENFNVGPSIFVSGFPAQHVLHAPFTVEGWDLWIYTHAHVNRQMYDRTTASFVAPAVALGLGSNTTIEVYGNGVGGGLVGAISREPLPMSLCYQGGGGVWIECAIVDPATAPAAGQVAVQWAANLQSFVLYSLDPVSQVYRITVPGAFLVYTS